jgi:hypothetical protein
MRVSRLFGVGILLVGFTVAGYWCGLRVGGQKHHYEKLRSQANFDHLELAFQIYHRTHGEFPPTRYQAEPNGPIHSWRVLLAPHFAEEHARLFQSWDFFKEWDSDENLRVFGNAPPHLRIYNPKLVDYGRSSEFTQYLAIGELDEWPTETPLASRLIVCGKDRFLLVEAPDSRIQWLEPKF